MYWRFSEGIYKVTVKTGTLKPLRRFEGKFYHLSRIYKLMWYHLKVNISVTIHFCICKIF